MIGGLVYGAVSLGSRIADEATNLAGRFSQLSGPERVANTNQPYIDRAIDLIQSQIRQHAGDIAAFLPRFGLRAISAAGDLVYIVIVPILSFFFLKDGRAMWAALLRAGHGRGAARRGGGYRPRHQRAAGAIHARARRAEPVYAVVFRLLLLRDARPLFAFAGRRGRAAWSSFPWSVH